MQYKVNILCVGNPQRHFAHDKFKMAANFFFQVLGNLLFFRYIYSSTLSIVTVSVILQANIAKIANFRESQR